MDTYGAIRQTSCFPSKEGKKFESRGYRKVNMKAGHKTTKKVKASGPQTREVGNVFCGTSAVEDSEILGSSYTSSTRCV